MLFFKSLRARRIRKMEFLTFTEMLFPDPLEKYRETETYLKPGKILERGYVICLSIK